MYIYTEVPHLLKKSISGQYRFGRGLEQNLKAWGTLKFKNGLDRLFWSVYMGLLGFRVPQVLRVKNGIKKGSLQA